MNVSDMVSIQLVSLASREKIGDSVTYTNPAGVFPFNWFP